MKAAVVVELGQAPVYKEFSDPEPAPGKSVVRVSAASISRLTRGRASGTHYSSDSKVPFVPGVDGTGVTEAGRRVYFLLSEAPFGAMAESTIVDDRRLIPLPEGLDDVTAAAIAIPGMSSWAALVDRANLRPGETVLINGATGTSGRLAIQIAKYLGAEKVIATGRNADAFGELRGLGADVTIGLREDEDRLASLLADEFGQGVDIVLDYLWGSSAKAVVTAAAKHGPEGVPIRFVQIGSIGGEHIELPAAALRSSALQLLGSGFGSVPFPRLLEAIQDVLNAAPSAGFLISTQSMPLSEVQTAWAMTDSDSRLVLRP